MRALVQAVVLAAVLALSLRRALFLVAALGPRRRLPHIDRLPSVAVLVPARNERLLAGRLVAALGELDYPAESLSFVLVCDGCSDDTPAILHAWADRRANARVLELPTRRGKGAALNAALQLADAEIVAVLDADLEAQPRFLREIVRPFADARVGGAAGFLRPANADENVVSRYAAVTTWVHQLVTSAGTDRLGLNPPTLGAAAFRRAAVLQIDGFPEVPAGVDVATSSRLVGRGWRTRFVASAVADNTVASEAGAFSRQHVRWSRAVFRADTAPRTVRPSLAQRLETMAASVGYGDRLVFVVATLCAILRVVPAWVPLVYLAVPGLEIIAAMMLAGVGARIPRFLAATALFFAVDVTCSISSVMIHVARRPYHWSSPRWSHVRGEHRE